MMKIKSILLVVFFVYLAGHLSVSIGAEAKPKPKPKPAAKPQPKPKPPAKPAPKPDPNAKARTAYDAARKAAQQAEAAVGPKRNAMQKADKAYAAARKVADDKRRKANDSKKLAGEEGVKELKLAEANVPATAKALEDAKKAKPALDKKLADARAAALPLQRAYDAAEKAAREAEARAKAAADAANRLQIEADIATARAAAGPRRIRIAKAALKSAQYNEQALKQQAAGEAAKFTAAENKKKKADQALANAKKRVADAAKAIKVTEKAYQEAKANSQKTAADKNKTKEEKKKAADEATAKRKARDAAKSALPKLQRDEKKLSPWIKSEAKNFGRAVAAKKKFDASLANAIKQTAAAAEAVKTAEKDAVDSVRDAKVKRQAAEQAARKRKAAADAAASLARARQAVQKAQAAVDAAGRKLAAAPAIKKVADDGLAAAASQVALATTAHQAADQTAKQSAARAKRISADKNKTKEEKKQAWDEAAAWRKVVEASRTAMSQTKKGEKDAQAKVRAADKNLADAQGKKKSADKVLADANKRLASAETAYQAAKKAAGEIAKLDEAARNAAAIAAEKRKAARAAYNALSPKQKALESALASATSATQNLARCETRKKQAEAHLVNLKKRIEDAKKTREADEKAAKEAEAKAAPLKTQADKTRAEYTAARNAANEKHALVEKAKASLYKLVAAGQVKGIMEVSDPPKPANKIDEIVFKKLKTLGVKPALCTDGVFLRRAYLDLTGKLPPEKEARTFILSKDRNKRAALVDRLLVRTENHDYWAMKWSDILRVKAEFPVKVWPNAAQAYHRWIWESMARNKPYDQFARELLTSSGSNFRAGAVNFYRAIQNRTPEGIASSVGLALMGSRIHHWPKDRRDGMAVFFRQVGYKPTSEWKEEIVFWDPLGSSKVSGSTAPGINAVAKSVTMTNKIPQALEKPIVANGPLKTIFPDGSKVTVPSDRDPREIFADWLISPRNPWFARAIVNRTWAWLVGRGIIHEPDDIRKDNPPSNPELLAYLEKELVSKKYDLKHIKRLIMTSTTYQFSSIPKSDKPEAAANFASYPMRRVEAEVLIDILNGITGSSDLYTSAVPEPFTYIPKDMTAVELADGSVTSPFLTLFGRSARATGMENERINELASTQWLHMLNSTAIQNKLQSGRNLSSIVSSRAAPKEITERLYLTILSRFPTAEDLKAAEEYAKTGVSTGRNAWIDLAWALINSPEFLLKH